MKALNLEENAWLKMPSGDALGRGMSERAAFESNPQGFFKRIVSGNKASSMPSLIVGYSSAMRQLSGVLSKSKYEQAVTFKNCWLQTDESNECSIDVWIHR